MERIVPDGCCDGCGAFESGRRAHFVEPDRDAGFLCADCLAERLDALVGAPPPPRPRDGVAHLRALDELRGKAPACWCGRGPEHHRPSRRRTWHRT